VASLTNESRDVMACMSPVRWTLKFSVQEQQRRLLSSEVWLPLRKEAELGGTKHFFESQNCCNGGLKGCMTSTP